MQSRTPGVSLISLPSRPRWFLGEGRERSGQIRLGLACEGPGSHVDGSLGTNVDFVSLRELLQAPNELRYQPAAGPAQPAQVALRRLRTEVADILPPGYRVRVSAAAQKSSAARRRQKT